MILVNNDLIDRSERPRRSFVFTTEAAVAATILTATAALAQNTISSTDYGGKERRLFTCFDLDQCGPLSAMRSAVMVNLPIQAGINEIARAPSATTNPLLIGQSTLLQPRSELSVSPSLPTGLLPKNNGNKSAYWFTVYGARERCR
jgi:hypothetical protein